MRVKSRWFRPGTDKPPEQVASAAAFIAFRVAQNALRTMRAAGYELPPGDAYFAFLAEFLAFLVHGADRIAYARGDEAFRARFVTSMANRVAEFLADNQADLIAAESAAGYKQRFISLVNARADDYASCAWHDQGPDYAFVRCLGHCVARTMSEPDRSWAISQLIEREAPEAAGTLQRAMGGLLDPAPRGHGRGVAEARGE
jgi:hypothetical protein